MRYLLDTMVASEARKARADARVATWLEATTEDGLAIDVLTLGEIERGVARDGLTLVARNTARTQGLGVDVLDPWQRG